MSTPPCYLNSKIKLGKPLFVFSFLTMLVPVLLAYNSVLVKRFGTATVLLSKHLYSHYINDFLIDFVSIIKTIVINMK